jgi:linoleate 10R-lipoxygenase
MDLSPLYGGGAGAQAKKVTDMRRLDGTGKLWDDTFADSRLLYMPPATASVLVLLNRNHNVSDHKHDEELVIDLVYDSTLPR